MDPKSDPSPSLNSDPDDCERRCFMRAVMTLTLTLTLIGGDAL